MSNKSIVSNIDELLLIISNDFEGFSSILDQIIGQIIKNPQHVSVFITHINVQLSNSSTRRKGLTLLSTFLPFCPYELCTEHAIAWMNNSLKYCENEREINYTAFKIIKSLLVICNKTPELNKIVVSTIIEKLIDGIKGIECNSRNSIIALDCLYTCLHTYPGACGSRKNNLQKYLMKYLDCTVPSAHVRFAAKCFNALQQVGGGGNDGINYYQNWNYQQQRLCATTHKLMDEFFESVTEFGDFQQELKDVPSLELFDLPECKSFQHVAYRLINTTIFLQEMLLGKYPVKKSILPVIILNVISRGLAINSSTLGVHIVEDMINLSSYLSLIHKYLLKLLQCLITSLGTNLIPWGTVICKLILNNLKSIQPNEAFTVDTLCDVRMTAYETLCLWITTVKGASGIDTLIDTLFPIIINDISPIKTEVNLSIQGKMTKNLSKKARKKLIEESTSNFAAKNLINKNVDAHLQFQQKVCVSSLQTLQTIIHYESFHVKPLLHKQMQEFIIKNLYNIQRGNIEKPYDEINCQIELYKSLIKITTNHHHNINPPIHYALNLLSIGQTNNNRRISDICSNGLVVLNSIVHPYCATLQIPLDINNVKADLKSNEKENSNDDDIESMEEEIIEINDTITDNCDKTNKVLDKINDMDMKIDNTEENTLSKTDINEISDSDELIIINDDPPKDDEINENIDDTSELQKMDVVETENNNQIEINNESSTDNKLIDDADDKSDNGSLDEDKIFSSFNDIVN